MSTQEKLLARHRRAIRAAAGMSRTDVVERAKEEGHGLSVDTLATAEAGRSVTERSLRAICAGLGCEVGLYLSPGAPVSVEVPEPAPTGTER